MQHTKRNILATTGVIGTVFGVMIAIPSFLQNNITASALASLLVIAGLVLLAIAFGE